jgi:23S rRNA (guanosine2251-2'-O)-methyltransferase
MKPAADEIIFGIRAVIEALDAGRELEKVLLRNSASKSEIFRDLKRRLKETGTPFQAVPNEKLNAITRKNHQGVVAYVASISYAEIDYILPGIFSRGETPLLLILDHVTDVRNFGAIARTAECAGVHAIILPFKGAARITGEAIKTSAGALHRIPVCRHPNLRELTGYLKQSGLKIVGASEQAGQSLFDADLNLPVAIVMGAEDKGISEPLLGEIDLLLSIPIMGSIESLNVSVATGIVLYETIRQRRLPVTPGGSVG